MSKKLLLGFGTFVVMAAAGATVPFVIACTNTQKIQDKQTDDIQKIEKLLLKQDAKIKDLQTELATLNEKATNLGVLLKDAANKTVTTFEALVVEYNLIKNQTVDQMTKDLDGQNITIDALGAEVLTFSKDKFEANITTITSALSGYKTKLETASKALKTEVTRLTKKVSDLETEKAALQKQIDDGITAIDAINGEIDKIISDYNKIFNIK